MEVESRSWLGLGGGRGGNDMVKFKTRLQGGPSGTLAFIREEMRERVVKGLLRVWVEHLIFRTPTPYLELPTPSGPPASPPWLPSSDTLSRCIVHL